jgi:hypothetical protein
MDSSTSDKVFAALEMFRIELPSWGFANTGTRFGRNSQLRKRTAIWSPKTIGLNQDACLAKSMSIKALVQRSFAICTLTC